MGLFDAFKRQKSDGAYRAHADADTDQFTELARAAFPEFASRISCFGSDWLGRQFALDRARIVRGQPQILLLEPGTGEALQIPADLAAFHDEILVNDREAALAQSLYDNWLKAGGAKPRADQCVGYNVPLYLGGADDVTNLSISDFDVYWTLSAQLLAKVRGLPPGTPIRNVKIGD